MKHNPEEIKEGDIVRLDKDFNNSSILTVVSITPLGMIATVRADNGNEWQVLTSRLNKISHECSD